MIKLTIGADPYKVLSVQKYSRFNVFYLIGFVFKGLVLPKVKSLVIKSSFLSQIANRCLLLTYDFGFEITFRKKNRSARQVKRNKIDVICFTQPAMAGNLLRHLSISSIPWEDYSLRGLNRLIRNYPKTSLTL